MCHNAKKSLYSIPVKKIPEKMPNPSHSISDYPLPSPSLNQTSYNFESSDKSLEYK